MKIIINLNSRCPSAGADTFDLFERDLPIGRNLFVAELQRAAGVFIQLFATDSLAGDIGADLDVKFPERFAMKHRIVADDFIHLQSAHVATARYFLNQFPRHSAGLILGV